MLIARMPCGNGWSVRAVTAVSIRKRAAAAAPPSRPTAIQAGALTVGPLATCSPIWGGKRQADSTRHLRPALQGHSQPDEGEAGGQSGADVGCGEAEVARADQLEQLQLQGGEGGQGAADPGGEEGVGEAVLGVVAQAGDEVAEQQ